MMRRVQVSLKMPVLIDVAVWGLSLDLNARGDTSHTVSVDLNYQRLDDCASNKMLPIIISHIVRVLPVSLMVYLKFFTMLYLEGLLLTEKVQPPLCCKYQ